MDKQEKITSLLVCTGREGIDKLVDYLITDGFFESPASIRYHGCYNGGLADHSYNVYEELKAYNLLFKLECPEESIVIAALLHDVCKIGAYIGDSAPYKGNRSKEKGHALLSIERIKRYIDLTELEEMMILYHMGVYGLVEFDEKSGEYTLRNKSMANAWYHHPIVKVMYFCDEIVTLKEKVS